MNFRVSHFKSKLRKENKPQTRVILNIIEEIL